MKKRHRHKRFGTKLKALALSAAIVAPTSIFSKDLVQELMKENVATFLDAAKLMMHSFNPKNGKVKGQDARQQLPDNLAQMSGKQIEEYLKKNGISLNVANRPISNAEVAKALVERYNLKKSWLTSVFGWSKLYFADAQKLGIFSAADQADEMMTTRNLLRAFLTAQNIAP